MPDKPDPIVSQRRTADADKDAPAPVDRAEAEAAADPIHPSEMNEAERHDPDPTEHPIQPAGQATSPMSDVQAKDHQRTGDPEEDAATMTDAGSTEDRVRLSTTVPKSVMAELDRLQDMHGLNSRGDALALVFDRGAGPGGLVPMVGAPAPDSPGLTDVIAESATPIEGTEDPDTGKPKLSTVNLPRHLQNY